MNKNFMLLLVLCLCNNVFAQTYRFQDPGLDPETRIDDLMKLLTLEEKVHLLYGNVTSVTADRFEGGGVERLSIKPIKMLDGPVGVRDFDIERKTTALPSTLSLSCTWDPDAAARYASLIASEMIYFDKHVVFGPGINLMKSPLCGRNFEYMGEDPYLTGTLATHYIRALQERRVAACAKHYVANDLDKWRHFTSSNLDERTLYEMHLMPFEMAVKDAHVWTVMSGNNLVNGVHVAENKRVSRDILKDDLGFDGVLLTDWRAAYNTINSALGGTDMTTGFCAYVFGDGNLLKTVKNGEVAMSLLDNKVRRVLKLYLRTGVLDNGSRGKGEVNTPEHQKMARRLAAEGMVLLKNSDNTLPIDPAKKLKIMVTGPAADVVPAGTGSSKVDSEISVAPLQGIQEAFVKSKITFLPYRRDKWEEEAKSYDIVLFFVNGAHSGESMDLETLELPENQSEAIKALTQNHDKVIVVTLTAGPFEMLDWVDGAEAILSGWFAGQATGQAIADVLTGNVNPGGKLSFTIGEKLNDYACHSLGVWPQKPIIDSLPKRAPADPEKRKAIHGYDLDYKERVFIGYRWFDKESIEPLFPFGYGLSYTNFSIENAGIEVLSENVEDARIIVNVKVTNAGEKMGSEVVQVYVADPQCSVSRPLRELKGFQKVQLSPGESKTISIALSQRAFAFWNEAEGEWTVEPGEFIIEVGNSSRNFSYDQKIDLRLN